MGRADILVPRSRHPGRGRNRLFGLHAGDATGPHTVSPDEIVRAVDRIRDPTPALLRDRRWAGPLLANERRVREGVPDPVTDCGLGNVITLSDHVSVPGLALDPQLAPKEPVGRLSANLGGLDGEPGEPPRSHT